MHPLNKKHFRCSFSGKKTTPLSHFHDYFPYFIDKNLVYINWKYWGKISYGSFEWFINNINIDNSGINERDGYFFPQFYSQGDWINILLFFFFEGIPWINILDRYIL